MTTVASAPGKVILLGEHAVVYEGNTAVAGTIDARSYVGARRLNEPYIDIRTMHGWEARNSPAEIEAFASRFYSLFDKKDRNPEELKKFNRDDRSKLAPVKVIVGKAMGKPNGRGLDVRIGKYMVDVDHDLREVPLKAHLGGSSSVFSATAAAATHELGMFDYDNVDRLAYTGDCLVVGKPSGIDSTVVTYGGALMFTKGATQPMRLLKLDDGIPLVVINTHEESNTGEMVARVTEELRAHPEKKKVLSEISRLALEGTDALRERDIERLGALMNRNHILLGEFPLTTMTLERARKAMLVRGIQGTKGSGAYGGGVVIGPAESLETAEIVAEELRSDGWDAWSTPWGVAEGARIERSNGYARAELAAK